MKTVRRFWRRLTAWPSSARDEALLRDEIEGHIALQTEDNLRAGLSPREARRQALLKFGSVEATTAAYRDQQGLPWLTDLARDVRHATRTLAREKGLTAVVVIVLGLGVGVNAGIFTLVDQVLLRPLPVSEPDRLVQVEWRGNKVGANYGSGSTLSYPMCGDLERLAVFEGVLCRHPADVNLSSGGETRLTRAEIVSGSYFRVLGVHAALGRLIDPSDNREAGAHPVVVLSYDHWRNRLGGPANIVGQRVLINAFPMTVIGVAPAHFRGVDRAGAPAVWIPAMMKRQATPEWYELDSRRTFWMHAIARLQPHVTIEQARAELRPWFTGMLQADLERSDFPTVSPEQRRSFLASTVDIVPVTRGIATLEARLERPLRVLMGGALLLLVLASLNVAGLLLARGVARTPEVALRLALGASRGRVARQFLVEGALIAALGGVLGLAVAPLVSGILRSFVPQGADVSGAIGGRVLLFALAIGAMTAAVCGLAPVFQAGRLAPIAFVTERSVGMVGRGTRTRKVLVAGQIAFALILLVTAGLFVQTLARLYGKGPGFDPANLVMFSLDPTSAGHPDDQAEQTMREVLRRLREQPWTERAAVAGSAILNGGMAGGPLTIEVGGERRVTDRIVFRLRISPGFIETLGLQLVDGRVFTEFDVRPAGAKPVPYRMAIVNETFARRYFGGRSPVGARLGPGNRPDTVADVEIVGVVREISRVDMRDHDVDQVFYNFWDNQSAAGTFYVRMRNPHSAAAAIGAVVAAVDPQLPVNGLTTLDDQIDRALFNERALAVLSTGFGALATVIAVVGLYGVMTFVAAQRRREIGLRVALGATRGDAVWLVVRHATLMVAAGVAAALPAVWALSRLIETQLFGITPFDWPTVALATACLALMALGASMLPAWRAAQLDPNTILKAG